MRYDATRLQNYFQLTYILPQSAIKTLIEQRFDAISTAPAESSAPSLPHAQPASASSSPKRHANGYVKDEVDDDADADVDGDEIQVSTQPPKKKQRKSEDTEDADAKLAAMLQAQENQLGGGRATRGGSKSKSKPAKKKKATPRKKSANKVRPEDDSDLSGSEGSGVKTRKAGGGFQKLMNLSAPLAEVCGGEPKVGVPINSRTALPAAPCL